MNVAVHKLYQLQERKNPNRQQDTIANRVITTEWKSLRVVEIVQRHSMRHEEKLYIIYVQRNSNTLYLVHIETLKQDISRVKWFETNAMKQALSEIYTFCIIHTHTYAHNIYLAMTKSNLFLWKCL